MQYVRQQITEFLSTNLTQEFPDWSALNPYTLEVTAPTSASVVRDGNYYYRNLLTSNTGFKPSEYLNTKWVKWKVANNFAMIDLSSSTKSVLVGGAIDATFALTPSMDTIGIGYYEARNITVELLDGLNNVVWTTTTEVTLSNSVVDWWTYMYGDYGYESDRAIMIKFPPALGTKCRVVFNESTESTRTACGFLVCGEAVDMGQTRRGVRLSFNSFASKQYDDFGTLSIVKRSVQDLIDFETEINAYEIGTMRRRIKDIYNDIVLFVVDETEDSSYENLLTLGVVESASEILTNAKLSTISWSVFEAI